MHASGIDSYDYAVQATVRGSASEFAVSSYQAGSVVGDLALDPLNDDWWADVGANGLIAAAWANFADPVVTPEVHQKNTGLGGFLGELPSLLVSWIGVQTFFGPFAAAAALLGKGLEALAGEISGEDDTKDLFGVFVKYGTVFVVNPAGVFPLAVEDLVEDVALRELIGLRPLRDAERALAREVFNNPDAPDHDTLPFDRIMLTKLANAGDRALVLPLFSGTILVNLGSAWDDPLGPTDDYPEPGSLLIHELVHAWQIAHEFSTPYWAAATLVEHMKKDDPYAIDGSLAGRSWSEWGREQQGALVDSWYAQFRTRLHSQEATADWRFRYIRDHLRLARG